MMNGIIEKEQGLSLDAKGPPVVGVLAVCINTAVLNLSEEVGASNNFYVKVSERNFCHSTPVSKKERGVITWNKIFHFPLSVEDNPRHPFNLLLVRLMTFSSQNIDEHVEIGRVNVHLHEIMRDSPSVTTLTLLRNLRIVGSVEIEFYFCYGLLGYGYSELMTVSQKQANSMLEDYKDVENLRFSIYPRVDPATLDTALLKEDDTKPDFVRMLDEDPDYYAPAGQILSPTSSNFSGRNRSSRSSEDAPMRSSRASVRLSTSSIPSFKTVEEADPPQFPLLAKQMTHLRPLQQKLQECNRDNRLERLGILFRQMGKSEVYQETSDSVGIRKSTVHSGERRAATQFLKPTIHFLASGGLEHGEHESSLTKNSCYDDDDDSGMFTLQTAMYSP